MLLQLSASLIVTQCDVLSSSSAGTTALSQPTLRPRSGSPLEPGPACAGRVGKAGIGWIPEQRRLGQVCEQRAHAAS
jgi:hypothetical protein